MGPACSCPSGKGWCRSRTKTTSSSPASRSESAEGQLFKAKNTQHVTLRGCLIHGNETETTLEHGVHFTHSSFGAVLGNEVHTTNRNAICAEACSDMTIERNLVHDNPAHNCIDLKNDGDTVTMPRNHIRFNRLTGCSNGILSAYQSDQEILGNVITNNDKSCIWLIDTDAPAAPYVANSRFVNNTCVDNAWDGVQNDRAQNLTIKNNIFSNSRREISIGSTANVGQVLDHNLYRVDAIWRTNNTIYSNITAWRAAMGSQEAQSLVADPQFSAPSSLDLSLKLGSPAIDKGENLGAGLSQGLGRSSSWPDQVVLLDQGQNGSGWEIGAYVYQDPIAQDAGVDAAMDAGPPVDSGGGDVGPAADSGPPADLGLPPDGPASDGPRNDGPPADGPPADGPQTDTARTDGPPPDGPQTDGGGQRDGPAVIHDSSVSEGTGGRSILEGGCSHGQIPPGSSWLLLLLLGLRQRRVR